MTPRESALTPSASARAKDKGGRPSPRVAVVIVNYRTADQTIACVESLASVTYRPLDVLVVDNDSGDGSAERFERELGGVLVLRASRNGGYTAGNNLGLTEALQMGADYVLVLNPDTRVVNPAFVSALVHAGESNPRIGAVGPRVYLRCPGQVQNTVLRFPWIHRRVADSVAHRLMGKPQRSGDVARDAEVLNGVCVLLRAAALRDVGLFDARTFAYIEDVDWAYRAQKRGWKRIYLPVSSIVHEQKETGYERGGTVEYLLKRNTLYFLLKTRRYFQAAGYTLATLSQGLLRLGSPPSRGLRWMRRIASSHFRLWIGQWDAVMGPP